MPVTLTNFVNHYIGDFVNKGKVLYDNNAVQTLTQDKLTWKAKVAGDNFYDVAVRIENNEVTDVFCSCQPVACPHVIALLFQLQKQFKINGDEIDPLLQPQPERFDKVDKRLVEFVDLLATHEKRSKRVEQLRKDLLHETPLEVREMKVAVQKSVVWAEYPDYYGAHELLKEADYEVRKKYYRRAFEKCQAVIVGLGEDPVIFEETNITCRLAIDLLGKIFAGKNVSMELKQEIFLWCIVFCSINTYSHFREDMIDLLAEHTKDLMQLEVLLKFIEGWSSHPENGGNSEGFARAAVEVADKIKKRKKK